MLELRDEEWRINAWAKNKETDQTARMRSLIREIILGINSQWYQRI